MQRTRTSRRTMAVLATAVTGSLALAACGGAGGPSSGGGKISDDKVVIGLLNDQSGVYKDLSGPNSKVAIQMAIDDYKAKYGDKAVAKDIEIVTADHQNKPDIANTKAQEMYDRDKADIILDVPTSSAALAVATQAKAKKKLFIDIGAGTTALTGSAVQQVHVPLGLRHLHARVGHRCRAGRGRRQELVDRLPRLRLRPGHDQVVQRRRRARGWNGAAEDRDAVPQRELRDLHHQGRFLQARRHRDHGRRW